MPRHVTPLLLAALALPAAAPAAGRPNFLVIVTDDQSPFDLKAYDRGSALDTPVLDRLAAEGVVLDAAYHMGAWVGAVCTPSRHMIMSGRSLWRIPSRPRRGKAPHNPNQADPKLVPRDLADFTMPAVFNRAGYATYRTCKVGNSYAAANRLFAERDEASKRGGTPEGGSAWHADRALAYLGRRAKKGDRRPFLIYLGFSHPHDPRDGPAGLTRKYGAVDPPAPKVPNPKAPPLPPSWLPGHPFPHGHPRLRDEVAVKGVRRARDEATVRNEMGRQYACAENIDRQIGRVLARLKEAGELKNTYVFFTSDHGIAVGRHGLMGKQNLYEHTWRVPFIVRGPGTRAGTRAAGNAYLFDLLPTLCDLAGIDAPETADGVSLRPILEGKSRKARDVLYGVYCGGTKPGMRAVRRGKWKLIEYDVLGGRVRRTQLFDLEANPHELLREHRAAGVVRRTGNEPADGQVNLAGDPRHAEKLAEMRALLRRERRRWDDPFTGFRPAE